MLKSKEENPNFSAQEHQRNRVKVTCFLRGSAVVKAANEQITATASLFMTIEVCDESKLQI
jgi:hypothetical protein